MLGIEANDEKQQNGHTDEELSGVGVLLAIVQLFPQSESEGAVRVKVGRVEGQSFHMVEVEVHGYSVHQVGQRPHHVRSKPGHGQDGKMQNNYEGDIGHPSS